jgi:hypothetical protein
VAIVPSLSGGECIHRARMHKKATPAEMHETHGDGKNRGIIQPPKPARWCQPNDICQCQSICRRPATGFIVELQSHCDHRQILVGHDFIGRAEKAGSSMRLKLLTCSGIALSGGTYTQNMSAPSRMTVLPSHLGEQAMPR